MSATHLKSVLITGCGSPDGIGWALAKVFHAQGYYVFATTRNPTTTTNSVDVSTLSNLEILELDVTDTQSIATCKGVVSKRTGGKLDILVNNAGTEFQSPLLDVDISEAKRLYDVNVWGVLAVTQVFAPLIITAKGAVVNQSSIDAALNLAWAGIYASSKAAEARMSDTLRVELAPFSVRVVTVMCGSVNTPFFTKPGGRMDLPESSYYYNVQETAYQERMDHKGKAMNVDMLANKLVKEIVGGANGQVWRGALSTMINVLTWLCPIWMVDKMVNGERGVGLARLQ